LTVGLLTRVAAFGIFADMLVAVMMVHVHNLDNLLAEAKSQPQSGT
jgi:uncharacterized membrane protein YphA (DoxX/SURF4 family)